VSLRFRILGSGSSGNATLVEAGATRILIDAGLGPRALTERLLSAGVDPASLAAVFLSHEHGDHARGAAALSAKWGVPLAGTRGTYAAAGLGAETIAGYEVLEPGATRQVGELTVTGVRVPHDASMPIAFVVAWGDVGLGHATDLGHLSASVIEAFSRCRTLLIESNHDPGLLRDGPYPWALKERILGPEGHLSNRDVARYLEGGLGQGCSRVVLAHLSEKNNHPELALASAEEALARAGRKDVRVELAGRHGTGWLEVAGARAPAPPGQMRLW
jgi:phosphoribosyl 1,2-cyclic phosphodiesterase